MIKTVSLNTRNDKNVYGLKASNGLRQALPNFWSALANGSTNGSSDLIPTAPIGLRTNLTDRNLLLTKQILKSGRPLR